MGNVTAAESAAIEDRYGGRPQYRGPPVSIVRNAFMQIYFYIKCKMIYLFYLIYFFKIFQVDRQPAVMPHDYQPYIPK